ncbi:hypothetical protein [Rhodococcus marinonascens]|uniref:hypothetical protein n=1 Tax=Rhodococcus marinonascens TaxID=38311 RepID=UPI0009FF31E3|nr:hypothetical protein [Rhodococcus marinonascens]
MTHPQTPQPVPEPDHYPTPQSADWNQVTMAALSEGHLNVDPEGLRRCIKMCQDHAENMYELAEQARKDLWIESLGIGEHELESARLLIKKFNDKAVGGGKIAHESSAVGLLFSHQRYALDMKATFEAVLRRYEEQEGITASALGQIGDNL